MKVDFLLLFYSCDLSDISCMINVCGASKAAVRIIQGSVVSLKTLTSFATLYSFTSF